MQLNKLLGSINIKNTYREQDMNIVGISYNSKAVSQNHIFVCIKGYKTDGHKYLADAVKNGAKAAIVEEINEHIDVPQFVVDNSRIALAQISATFYNHPSNHMQMIGITATNGKTTTSYMANAILEAHHLKTGLIGTINVKIGDSYEPSTLTTPESLELQKYFNEMVENNISHTMMEVSSAAQEMNRVDMIDFDIVSLNNINREHIDTHGSFERYVDVKTRLIKNAGKDSVAILNLDCSYAEDLIHKTSAIPVTFSVHKGTGDVIVKDLDLSTGRAKFTMEIKHKIITTNIEIPPMEFDIELAIPGLHSVSNSMVAIMIALLNGVPVTTIQSALTSFKGVERRFEFIYENGPIIVDDHFANPGNIDVTLKTISLMHYDKLHLIYAIRGQRGEGVNRENAESIVKWAKKLQINDMIATKSISDVTAHDEVTDGELNVFMEVMKDANINVLLFDELTDAISEGVSHASQEDLILLAGCQGMDHGAEIALKQLDSFSIRI